MAGSDPAIRKRAVVGHDSPPKIAAQPLGGSPEQIAGRASGYAVDYLVAVLAEAASSRLRAFKSLVSRPIFAKSFAYWVPAFRCGLLFGIITSFGSCHEVRWV